MSTDNIFNTELLKIARAQTAKVAFTDAATAVQGAGADPMAGVDPMAGAMPPMPGMGGDPAAGGMPPEAATDPMAAGGGMPPEGGGGVTAEEVKAIVQEAMMGMGGGAGGGGAGGEKMKVDVNTEIYHIKSLLTRIAGELGIKMEPQMLMGDPAMDPAIPNEQAAQDPNSAAASAISPIEGIQGASQGLAAAGGGAGGMGGEMPKAASDVWQHEHGHAFDSSVLTDNNDKASALASQLRTASEGSLVGAN